MKLSIIKMVLMVAIMSSGNVFAFQVVQEGNAAGSTTSEAPAINNEIKIALNFSCNVKLAATVSINQRNNKSRTEISFNVDFPKLYNIRFDCRRNEDWNIDSQRWKSVSWYPYPQNWYTYCQATTDEWGHKFMDRENDELFFELEAALVTTPFFEIGDRDNEGRTVVKVPLNNKTQEGNPYELSAIISASNDKLAFRYMEATPSQLSGDFFKETIRKINDLVLRMYKGCSPAAKS